MLTSTVGPRPQPDLTPDPRSWIKAFGRTPHSCLIADFPHRKARPGSSAGIHIKAMAIDVAVRSRDDIVDLALNASRFNAGNCLSQLRRAPRNQDLAAEVPEETIAGEGFDNDREGEVRTIGRRLCRWPVT